MPVAGALRGVQGGTKCLCLTAKELQPAPSRKPSATEGRGDAAEADPNRQEAPGNHSKRQVSLSFLPT